MNKKNYRLFLFLVFTYFFGIFCVQAECTNEQQKKYQNMIENVNITYKHENSLFDENNELVNGFFSVYIEGLTNELSVYNEERKMLIVGNNDGKVIKKFGFTYGTYEFKLFVNKSECSTIYKNINLSLPKYNSFSDSYLCNGIDSTEFLPCNKWYEYDLDESTFLARLTEYKNNKIKSESNIISKVGEGALNFFDIFIKSIINNWLLYLVVLIVILLVCGYVIYYFYKKKKSDKKWK